LISQPTAGSQAGEKNNRCVMGSRENVWMWKNRK
jgi:hypothetical protein